MASPADIDIAATVSTSKRSFWAFVRNFWDTVPGAAPLVANWHMAKLCEELELVAGRVFRNEPKAYDLVCNISPGTSKSTLFSILFPAWVWTRMPTARFITASHTSPLVLDLATKSRAVIESDLYQRCFPHVRMAKDQDAKAHYRNTAGGDRFCCTAGGKTPTGQHAHFVISDDLLDPQGAMSDATLEEAGRFIPDTLSTRAVNKEVTVFMLVMQRLHPRDPTGVLLENAKKDGTTPIRHICLPAEEADNISPPEWRQYYVDGLMDPNRLSRRALATYKANPFTYAGQFGQQPVPRGGGQFKPEYFNKRCAAAPRDAVRIRAFDRASTADGGCYTAGVLIAKDREGSYYVEHVVHGQWEPVERNRIMRATALRDRTRYGPAYAPRICVEREGGSSGRDAWLGVVRALDGFRVEEVTVTGSKDTRAEPWSTQLAAGNVFIVEDGTWDVQGYIDEHKMFRPTVGARLGKYKDQVDASSLAYNILAGMRSEITGPRVITLGKPRGKVPRIVHMTYAELADSPIHDGTAIMVCMGDPVEGVTDAVPLNGVEKLLGTHFLRFVALDPNAYQDRWNVPVDGYGKPPPDLLVTREQTAKLWGFLTRRRDPVPDTYLFIDDDASRALSVVLAVADVMRHPREQSVFAPSFEGLITAGTAPPVKHTYDLIRAGRSLVL
jgi:predicted phage terminase large subunit-like protein